MLEVQPLALLEVAEIAWVTNWAMAVQSAVICVSREHIRSPPSHLSPASACLVFANSFLLSTPVAIQIQTPSNQGEKHHH